MREILISMGYRETINDTFAKPVAFNLFTFEFKDLTWTNWFSGTNNKILVWDSDVYEKDEEVEDDFLRFIKNREAYTRLNSRNENNMEFLTLKEKIDLLV